MFSHVKWFVEEDSLTTSVDALSSNEWIFVAVVVALAVGFLWWINSYLHRTKVTDKLDKIFEPARPYVGTVVRVVAGLLLLINASYDYLLAPDIVNDGLSTASGIRAIFIFAGFLLVFGLFTRLGAALMALGYISTLLFVDSSGALDHIEYLGLAAYIFLQGGCRFSCDELLLDKSWVSKYNHLALPALRVFTGAGLVVLAFSEKLSNVSLAQEFLYANNWNIMSFASISDRNFIIVAGIVELVVGLSLIFNWATRLTTLALLVLMVITAALLGMDEVVGHLFAVAVVFAVWGKRYQAQAANLEWLYK